MLNRYNTNIHDFHVAAHLHHYRRSSWLPMEGEGANTRDMISPSTSLLLLDWEEEAEEEEKGLEMVDGETDWPRFWNEELDWMLLNLT